MEINANKILDDLRGLSEEADHLISGQAARIQKLNDWFQIVQGAVKDIVNSSASKSVDVISNVPRLPAFLTGDLQRKRSTLGSMLTHAKVHKTPKPKKTSARNSRSKSSLNNKSQIAAFSTPRKSSKRQTPKQSSLLKKLPNVVEIQVREASNSAMQTPQKSALENKQSRNVLDRPTMTSKGTGQFSTPVAEIRITRSMKKTEETDRRRNKRKSSVPPEAMRDDSKRLKVAYNPQPTTSSLLKQATQKQAGLTPNAGSSKLKENLPGKKGREESNRKKILSERQQKIDENKKKRMEKMQKAAQKRSLLEKERESRLMSKQPALGTPKVPDPALKAEQLEKLQKPMRKLSSAVKAAEDLKTITPKTHNCVKTQLEIPKPTRKLKASNIVTPSSAAKPMTPLKDNHTVKPASATKKLYVAENYNKENTFIVDAANKTMTLSKPIKPSCGSQARAPAAQAPSAVSRTPKGALPTATTTTSATKKSDHDLMPPKESLQSYELSDIASDSDDDDAPPNNKPIPQWSVGSRFKKTLMRWHHSPPDTDIMFGNFFSAVDIVQIVGQKMPHYTNRTSSAIWDSPSQF